MDTLSRAAALTQIAKETEFLRSEIALGDADVRIKWKTDFRGYEVPQRKLPQPQGIIDELNLNVPKELSSHLRKGDFDVLAYQTCDTLDQLQNCQDRMDWFFYIDIFVDESKTASLASVSAAVKDLKAWLKDEGFVSQIEWVNNANKMLSQLFADAPPLPESRQLVKENIAIYYNSLVNEKLQLSFSEYLRNRLGTIGAYPEVEFCFAYQNKLLTRTELEAAESMKQLMAWATALQNDATSAAKEREEEDHASLYHYFESPEEFASFVEKAYSRAIDTFMALRPEDPTTALHDYWHCCQQWICGSLVWHLTTKRYRECIRSVEGV